MARKKKKGSLKRWLLIAGGLLVLLLFSIFLVGVIWLQPLVKKGLETYGPEALGAEVKLEDVNVRLVRGIAKIDGLVIGNPEGFKEPVAIDARHFEIHLQTRSLFSDTVVIEEILLEGPVVTYEKAKGTNNIKQLQENAMAWAKSLSSKEKEGPSKKVVIERLRILDGTLRVKLPGLPAVPIKLADIERRNIGGETGKGQNFGHAAKDVLASLQLNASDTVKQSGEAIEKAAKDALKAGKDVGDKALKAGEKVLDDAGNALKGLLGK